VARPAPDPRPEALDEARERHATEVRFGEFLQWMFDRQWRDLRAVAADEGVSIVGDVPIYVALDSADVWANPEAFRLDEGTAVPRSSRASRRTRATTGIGAGAGEPVYDWDRLAERDYDWWIARFRRLFELADVARLDHFLGFVKYWAIPADADDPAAGEWCEGPGRDLFETVERELGQAPFIAEDLGFEEPAMDELMVEFGFPGCAFRSTPTGVLGEPVPADALPRGVVGYTSTHDTTWVNFEGLPERQRDCFRYNVGADGDRPPIIDEVWASEAVFDDASGSGANRGSTSREPSPSASVGGDRVPPVRRVDDRGDGRGDDGFSSERLFIGSPMIAQPSPLSGAERRRSPAETGLVARCWASINQTMMAVSTNSCFTAVVPKGGMSTVIRGSSPISTDNQVSLVSRRIKEVRSASARG